MEDCVRLIIILIVSLIVSDILYSKYGDPSDFDDND